MPTVNSHHLVTPWGIWSQSAQGSEQRIKLNLGSGAEYWVRRWLPEETRENWSRESCKQVLESPEGQASLREPEKRSKSKAQKPSRASQDGMGWKGEDRPEVPTVAFCTSFLGLPAMWPWMGQPGWKVFVVVADFSFSLYIPILSPTLNQYVAPSCLLKILFYSGTQVHGLVKRSLGLQHHNPVPHKFLSHW